MNGLKLKSHFGITALNGGLFKSIGKGTHPCRTMPVYELIFVRKGTLKIFEDKTDFDITAGQTLLLRPKRQHGGREEYLEDLEFYWVHFKITQKTAKKNYIEVPKVCKVSSPDRLEYLFRNFLDQQDNFNPYQPTLDLLMMQILCEVSRPVQMVVDMSPNAVRLAQRTFNWIKVNYTNDISSAVVAKAIMCNRDYLGRVFKKVYNQTITDCIQHTRIEAAKKMLLFSDLNIEQISLQSGFHDSGYFRRIFSRQEGLSPRKFRQLNTRIYVNTE